MLDNIPFSLITEEIFLSSSINLINVRIAITLLTHSIEIARAMTALKGISKSGANIYWHMDIVIYYY